MKVAYQRRILGGEKRGGERKKKGGKRKVEKQILIQVILRSTQK